MSPFIYKATALIHTTHTQNSSSSLLLLSPIHEISSKIHPRSKSWRKQYHHHHHLFPFFSTFSRVFWDPGAPECPVGTPPTITNSHRNKTIVPHDVTQQNNHHQPNHSYYYNAQVLRSYTSRILLLSMDRELKIDLGYMSS
jgi:hypothetical protein